MRGCSRLQQHVRPLVPGDRWVGQGGACAGAPALWRGGGACHPLHSTLCKVTSPPNGAHPTSCYAHGKGYGGWGACRKPRWGTDPFQPGDQRFSLVITRVKGLSPVNEVFSLFGHSVALLTHIMANLCRCRGSGATRFPNTRTIWLLHIFPAKVPRTTPSPLPGPAPAGPHPPFPAVGTTAYGGKGSKGRAVSGDRPIGAASCRPKHTKGVVPTDPFPE